MRIWGQPEPGEVESGQDINALNAENANDTKGRQNMINNINLFLNYLKNISKLIHTNE